MAYRRNYHSYNNWQVRSRVNVTFAWNSLVGAYDLKFENIKGDENWMKLKGILAWIKLTIPYGERDYDDVEKIWTIHEKYFDSIKNVLNNLGPEFSVTCVEKPIGSPAVTFTPMSVYFDIFKSASGEDISSYGEADFSKAKRIYFRTSMKIHPDKGGDHRIAADFNEAWDVIKERHFKIQRVMAQMET